MTEQNNGQEQGGRRLSRAEVARKESFIKLSAELEKQGYRRENLTFSAVKANLLGIVAGLIPGVPFAVVYLIVTHGVIAEVHQIWYMLFLPVFLASVVIHELLHGAGWSIFAEGHFKSIAFGVIWQMLTPYCTCKVPLRKGHYITGLLLPAVILGIIPCILACIFGSIELLFFGGLMLICAGCDLLIFVLILRTKLNGDVLFLDHPTDIGLVAFFRENK